MSNVISPRKQLNDGTSSYVSAALTEMTKRRDTSVKPSHARTMAYSVSQKDQEGRRIGVIDMSDTDYTCDFLHHNYQYHMRLNVERYKVKLHSKRHELNHMFGEKIFTNETDEIEGIVLCGVVGAEDGKADVFVLHYVKNGNLFVQLRYLKFIQFLRVMVKNDTIRYLFIDQYIAKWSMADRPVPMFYSIFESHKRHMVNDAYHIDFVAESDLLRPFVFEGMALYNVAAIADIQRADAENEGAGYNAFTWGNKESIETFPPGRDVRAYRMIHQWARYPERGSQLDVERNERAAQTVRDVLKTKAGHRVAAQVIPPRLHDTLRGKKKKENGDA